MRNGLAYQQVLWVPATNVTAGGALPTPKASDGDRGRDRARVRPDEKGRELATVLRDLLPTPAAIVPNDGEKPDTWLARRERVKLTANNGNGMGMPLSIAVQLLPTPRTCSAMAAPVNSAGNLEGDQFPNLETVVGRMLPTPTTRDWKDGSQQACQNVEANGLLGRGIHQAVGSTPTGEPMYLNPAFVEEMMGFPPEWTA
jgi:hypothetical protein